MIRQRDNAGAEANPLGAFRDSRDHQLRRRDDLVSCRVMLADPRLIEADAIEMLDQVDIAADRKRRIFIDWVKGSEKDSRAQAVWSNSWSHLNLN